MSINPEQMKAKRLKLLRALYDELHGSVDWICNGIEFGKTLGMDKDEARNIIRTLDKQGYLRVLDFQHDVMLTTSGIELIERENDKPTIGLPINVVQIENVNHSPFQIGTSNSTITTSYQEPSINDYSKLLDEIKAVLPNAGLSKEDYEEAESEIATVDSQLKSPKPKFLIIKECLRTLRNIGEGAIGSLIASSLWLMILGA